MGAASPRRLRSGADGAAFGTRLIASDECEAHADYKRRVLEASEEDTVHCGLFSVGWPDAPHRVLKNALTDGAAPGTGVIARMQLADRVVDVPPFASMPPSVATEGRTDLMANYAGQGVGLIRDILPAATIVEQIVSGAETTIARLAALAPRRS